jgi:hypothetical protein
LSAIDPVLDNLLLSTAPAYYVSGSGSDSNAGTFAAPFLTLAHAQAMMEASQSNPQTVYVRSGTYANVALVLSSADNGQTWSYYPPDGYNNAVLDGGSSSPTTPVTSLPQGRPVFTLEGASSVTIIGFTIQNYLGSGVAIFGGAPPSLLYSGQSPIPSSSSDFVLDNIFSNGYIDNTKNGGYNGGAVWAVGQVTNLTVDHNAATNQYGSCFRFNSDPSGGNPDDSYSGLTVTNNACLVSNEAVADNGAIYLQDLTLASKRITIENNFVRDYQSLPALRPNHTPANDVAFYLDLGASNTKVSGNIAAAAANPIANGGPTEPSTTAVFTSSGQNNSWIGNIVDLGAIASGVIQPFIYGYQTGEAVMTGNVIEQNILIGSWSGPQNSWGASFGGYAFPACCGLTDSSYPTVMNNLYYNFGGGAISHSGNDFSDTTPTIANPLFAAGCVYALTDGSPAFSAPVIFPPILGGWGPPGYTVPCTGTPPSY